MKRRNTVWDDFIFFDPKSDRLILVCRDCAWGGEVAKAKKLLEEKE